MPCSLLRLWIRDLPEPVIPYDMYQLCIQGAQDKDAVAKVVNSLPMWHKEMIIYLVSFLKVQQRIYFLIDRLTPTFLMILFVLNKTFLPFIDG